MNDSLIRKDKVGIWTWSLTAKTVLVTMNLLMPLNRHNKQLSS